MKIQAKYQNLSLDKYDVFVLLIVTVAIASIVIIWIWFGHRNEQLENELYKLK